MPKDQLKRHESHPLTFTKMAGGGNDFVIIDNRRGEVADPVELTRRICTAHLSVGADGLILIEPSERADFRIRYFNNDGSLGEFCANGTRCAARFAVLHSIAGKSMTIETDAGIAGAEVGEGTSVTLAVPPPRNYRAERPLRAADRMVRGSSIVTGVPHYVVLAADDLWTQDIVPLGRAIRFHPDLKSEGGANADFVTVRGEHSIEVRTYERGVEAETLSCGSGVVAAVAVCALGGNVISPVSILTRSGIVFRVSFVREGDDIRDLRLTGDARLIYTAELTPETIHGFDPDFVRQPSERVESADSV